MMGVKNQQKVSAEELVQRAHDMIPKLRERAADVEKNGMVSAETIEEFKQAGFFKITQPAKVGGYEMNIEVFCKVLMEIGRGCPSSAWVLGVLGVHNWEMGLLDDKALEEIWGEDPDVLISSSYSPFGTATRVDGGWIVNGTWKSSSGCDHAQWAVVGAYEYGEDGKILDQKALFIPRTEYTIYNDWDVYGLKGTGSKSLIIDNVFVPDHRCHSNIEQPWSDRPSLYLLHQTFVFFTSVSSGIIGFAQGAIDLYIEEMKTRQSIRKNNYGSNNAKQSPYVKDRLGNAILKVRSSRARLLQAVREANEFVERGEQVPALEMITFALDTASVGRECSEAVTLLHRAQSARGVWNGNAIQRIFRDIQAAANHGTQNSDDTAGILGGFILGESIPPGLFNIKGIPGDQSK